MPRNLPVFYSINAFHTIIAHQTELSVCYPLEVSDFLEFDS